MRHLLRPRWSLQVAGQQLAEGPQRGSPRRLGEAAPERLQARMGAVRRDERGGAAGLLSRGILDLRWFVVDGVETTWLGSTAPRR